MRDGPRPIGRIVPGRSGPQERRAVDGTGSFNTAFRLLWSVDVTEAMRRFWNDPDETAEQGAYALALLLLRSLARLTVLERSRKGTGFDWWLASQDNLFQAAARLEVS